MREEKRQGYHLRKETSEYNTEKEEEDTDTDTDTWFIVQATDPFTTTKKKRGGGGVIFSLGLHS